VKSSDGARGRREVIVLSHDTEGSGQGAGHRTRPAANQRWIARDGHRLRLKNGRKCGGNPTLLRAPSTAQPDGSQQKQARKLGPVFSYVSPRFPSSVLCWAQASQQVSARRGVELEPGGCAVSGQRRRTPGDRLLLCKCASARGSKSIDLLALRARPPNLPPSAPPGSAQMPVRYRHSRR